MGGRVGIVAGAQRAGLVAGTGGIAGVRVERNGGEDGATDRVQTGAGADSRLCSSRERGDNEGGGGGIEGRVAEHAAGTGGCALAVSLLVVSLMAVSLLAVALLAVALLARSLAV
ncbi:unnamed protein product [Closterium sp. Naga37s-1]|nr:unnamed protein product [Closterium sp. Naga37s-1]